MKRIPLVSLRLVREKTVPYGWSKALAEAARVAELIGPIAGDYDRESMWVVCLDPKLRPTNVSMISLGTVSECHAHPREILKIAIASNAHAIIMAHNHPSGDTEPSDADAAITKRLASACELMGIKFLDHLIVSGSKYYSFNEAGRI